MSEHAVVLKPAVQPVARMGAGMIQRACACGSQAGGGECESCQKKKLQKRADGASPAEAAVSPIVAQVIASQGRPLECEVRGFMESRFGRDFSQVRFIPTRRAARSGAISRALAYTVARTWSSPPDSMRRRRRKGAN